MGKTMVLWKKNYSTMEKTMVLYRKIWYFDLLWKKSMVYEKNYGTIVYYSIFCLGLFGTRPVLSYTECTVTVKSLEFVGAQFSWNWLILLIHELPQRKNK